MRYLRLSQLLLCLGHRLELLASRSHLNRRQDQTQENLAQSCLTGNQCCGSVTFSYGSGSSHPYDLWLTDPEHWYIYIIVQNLKIKSHKVKKHYLSLTNLDADPGGPITYGSYGSGSATLQETNKSPCVRQNSHKNTTLKSFVHSNSI